MDYDFYYYSQIDNYNNQKQKQKMNYNKIFKIAYECNSAQMTSRKFESYIAGAKIGNKSIIKQQIKLFLPEWFNRLEMQEKTSFKFQITETHIIIPHNSTQYFFNYKKTKK